MAPVRGEQYKSNAKLAPQGPSPSGEFEGSESSSARAGWSNNHNPIGSKCRQRVLNTPKDIRSGIMATSYLANISTKEPALRSNLKHLRPILNSIVRFYRKFPLDQDIQMYRRENTARFTRLEKAIKQAEMQTKAKGIHVVTFDDDGPEIIP